ncbi:MAG: malectin domain-containing carbohydrate-binding protein [Spirochaetota bacterium]|mgnify:CR=1 FL=1
MRIGKYPLAKVMVLLVSAAFAHGALIGDGTSWSSLWKRIEKPAFTFDMNRTGSGSLYLTDDAERKIIGQSPAPMFIVDGKSGRRNFIGDGTGGWTEVKGDVTAERVSVNGIIEGIDIAQTITVSDSGLRMSAVMTLRPGQAKVRSFYLNAGFHRRAEGIPFKGETMTGAAFSGDLCRPFETIRDVKWFEVETKTKSTVRYEFIKAARVDLQRYQASDPNYPVAAEFNVFPDGAAPSAEVVPEKAMSYEMLVTVVAKGKPVASTVPARTEYVYDRDLPDFGIGVYPLAEQTWRSKTMIYPEAVSDKDRVWSGDDFFTWEYGAPLDFSKDAIALYGYAEGAYTAGGGALTAATGPKGFTFGFGTKVGVTDTPGIRYGLNWVHAMKDNIRLRMVIEQDRETEWRFLTANWRGYEESKRFKIFGTGRQEFEVDAGLVRVALSGYASVTGLRFECLTPNASISIREMKLAPSSANVYFRKKIALLSKPVYAPLSLRDHECFDLVINGTTVLSGAKVYPVGAMRHIDIAQYLIAGENTICYRREFLMWSGDANKTCLIECAAVGRDGAVTRIIGDETWKCSLRAESAWTDASFDDASWKTPKTERAAVTKLADYKTEVSEGYEPKHMGMLDSKPSDRMYPVFERTAAPAFKLRIPAGIAFTPEVIGTVYKAGTALEAERISVSSFAARGDFLISTAAFRTRTPGPYRIEWTLLSNKQTIERKREELIITGPVVQDTVSLADFERTLTERMKRVWSVECTAAGSETDFIDHAGMYNAPKMNKGRVTTNGTLVYRETGSGTWDYFAYRMRGLAAGEPHIVEVIVPDDDDRYIYSGVMQADPIVYPWNLPGFGRFASTGACFTGGRYPLTGKTRAIRYVHWPRAASEAVVVMSGRTDSRGAACRIIVYRIEGDLPALAVPATGRLFGDHLERISLISPTVGCENALENDPFHALNGHRDAWYHWYRMFERKIKLYRFLGKNMAIEGLYMYSDAHYPSERASIGVSSHDFDKAHLLMKMYAENGIRIMLGLEYIASPEARLAGVDAVSDRRMWQGAGTAQLVDRYGRQAWSRTPGGNGDFMHPETRKHFLAVVRDIYDRYAAVAPVEGLFLVEGMWWMPTFASTGHGSIASTDVGYGDRTAALFEEESGIKLSIDAQDTKRFAKRFDALMGTHRDQWIAWRGKKVKEMHDDIAEVIASGTQKWKLMIYPAFQSLTAGNPFTGAATRQDRDRFLTETLRTEYSLPLERYRDDARMQIVTPLMAVGWKGRRKEEFVTDRLGFNTCEGTRAAVASLGTLYSTGPLDEVDCPTGAAAKWLWTKGLRGVFIPRGVEDNAMNDYVSVMRDTTPNLIVTAWLDCNLETGFGEQQRRFTKAYYATPALDFAPLPADRVRGAAMQYAKGWVRLVNHSPYPASGILTGISRVHDAVYDRDITAGPNGIPIELKPNDIRLFRTEGAEHAGCDLSFPAAVADGIRQEAKKIIDSPGMKKELPEDIMVKMNTAYSRSDAFALYALLDDFELNSARKSARMADMQALFLDDLAKTKHARIDCAGTAVYVDRAGKRWLPDQAFGNGNAYGNVNANFADRGTDLAIENTEAPRMHQTEAYGDAVFYRIPVPNGAYHVHLHFAETYVNNKSAGKRAIAVAVNGRAWDKRVDPFSEAGGFAKAVVLSEKNCNVVDGMIVIEMKYSVGINGIEIELVQ